MIAPRQIARRQIARRPVGPGLGVFVGLCVRQPLRCSRVATSELSS